MDSYKRRMQEKENMCNAFIRKADDAYYANDGQHSKMECAYLQKAAMLRAEMKSESIGAEKEYQDRMLQELNAKIRRIIMEIDPDYYRQKLNSDSNDNKNSGGSSSSEGAASNSEAEDDALRETVKKWFKETPKHSFEDVAGMSALKEQLSDCIADSKMLKLKAFMKMKSVYSYFFIGPPGCGKTYIIEAFAHELMSQDYKYISLVGSDILSRYVGEAEKIVSRVFEEARKNAPCIVFIDEVDGVCKNRSQANLPEYAASLTTAFLTGYNTITDFDKPIIFIGATNYPNQVDNAMLDRVELIRVPFPDKEARKSAFEKNFSSWVDLADDISYEEIADVTENYNYRDISRLVARIKNRILRELIKKYPNEDQALEALQNKEYKLTREMFFVSKEQCLPTPKEDIIKDLDDWEAKFNQDRG